MKYKVGDKVKIVDKWVDGCLQHDGGLMDKYLGTTMTIESIHDSVLGSYCVMKGNDWNWFEPAIAGYAPITLEEFFASEKKLVIHCDTKEKAKKLCKAVDDIGRKWCSGNSYVEYNCWYFYDKDTCYTNNGEYCGKAYYETEGTPIYKFEEIIFEEECKMKKFKVGDRVKCIKPFDGAEECVGLYGTIICFDDSYDCGVEFDKNIYGHSCNGKGKGGHCRYGNFDELELVSATTTITITTNGVTTTATMGDKSAIVKCHVDDEFSIEVGAKLAIDRLFEKPQIKIEVGKYYKLKPYDEVTNPMCIDRATWERFYKNPVKVLHVDKDCHVEVFYNDGNTEKWFIALSSFECETKPLYNGKVVCIDNKCNSRNYTVGKIYQFVNGQLKTDCADVLPKERVSSFEEWAKFTSAKFIEIKEDATK